MKLLALLLAGAAILPGEGGSADLAVTQSSPSAQEASINGRTVYAPVRYTVTVTNNGPDVAFDTHIAVTPSAPVRSMSEQCSSADRGGGAEIDCPIGDVQPGASASVVIETLPEHYNQLESKATVRSQTPDPVAENDSSSYTPSVVIVDPAPPPPEPDRSPADSDIRSPRDGFAHRSAVTQIRGTARDDKSGVSSVEIAVRRRGGKRCVWLSGRAAKFTSKPMTGRRCNEQVWLDVSGTTSWRYRLSKKLPRGSYVVISRATDGEGQAEKSFSRADRNLAQFKVR